MLPTRKLPPPRSGPLPDGSLQLIRWVDEREDHAPTTPIEAYEAIAVDLAEYLDAAYDPEVDKNTLPANRIQAVIGLRSGYSSNDTHAPLAVFQTEESSSLPGWEAHLVYLRYAGAMTDGRVDPYKGDKMALVRAERTPEAIAHIKHLADVVLEQYHFTIEAEVAAIEGATPEESVPAMSVSYAGRASGG